MLRTLFFKPLGPWSPAQRGVRSKPSGTSGRILETSGYFLTGGCSTIGRIPCKSYSAFLRFLRSALGTRILRTTGAGIFGTCLALLTGAASCLNGVEVMLSLGTALFSFLSYHAKIQGT